MVGRDKAIGSGKCADPTLIFFSGKIPPEIYNWQQERVLSLRRSEGQTLFAPSRVSQPRGPSYGIATVVPEAPAARK